jgi:hypothetical protein
MSAEKSLLGIAMSGTPLEKEYQLVCDGLARTPALVLEFHASAYDPRLVTRIRDQWTQRMAGEHRSTTVFSNLAGQLIEANAPLDAKVVMLRMAQDELRHTETCGQVVQALGGKPEVRTDLSVAPLATHRGCPVEERALRNVIYTTCLSEMVAVARLVDELDTTEDPFLRDATRRLLADEVLHGQFGFLYLEALRPWLEAHAEVVASIHRYLVHAFAVLEVALGGRAVRTRLSDQERALGINDPAKGREIFYETIEGAVAPGLDRFGLDATKAWRERRLLEGGEVPPRPQ